MQTPLRIGIVGGGFSGAILAATLCRLQQRPLEIFLFDKSGNFGAGPAYSTPYLHHLLNVRANDMSAFEDDLTHFVNWLKATPDKLAKLDSTQALEHQFVPRNFYYDYLQSILAPLQSSASTVTFVKTEVVGAEVRNGGVVLQTSNQPYPVDKVVLALGNPLPASFPFAVAEDMSCIHNPWDYRAVEQIPSTEPVCIVGMGLSMIDAVLTLHYQGHRAPIYAVSRHGLLPLPHGAVTPALAMGKESVLAHTRKGMRMLTRHLRRHTHTHVENGGDWREVVGGLRPHTPDVWRTLSLDEKKRFLRHVMPYWNIHRHRVHSEIMALLAQLKEQGQLILKAGKVLQAAAGQVTVARRHSTQRDQISARWLINCMGPSQEIKAERQPLLASLFKQNLAQLDALRLGLDVSPACSLRDQHGQASSLFYSLGTLTRGESWEVSAVPDIRKQITGLARHLLATE